ncbi:hypothetical protein NPX13_g7892 [Xylaria arbuscula]|uniref:Uncharacterized protein n=1 Tax=Xylaria arbuscula TaxID=114810 RepID=A0A9W8N9T3_9PEZI|nr:hypothetical protein NPX13_g7892 [Xylaria arbuscula]
MLDIHPSSFKYQKKTERTGVGIGAGAATTVVADSKAAARATNEDFMMGGWLFEYVALSLFESESEVEVEVEVEAKQALNNPAYILKS